MQNTPPMLIAAWVGYLISQTGDASVANACHIRYKGYFWDASLALYYCQSRYYDPQVGRFINADDPNNVSEISNVLDANFYAYCENNPDMNSDEDGRNSTLNKKIQNTLNNLGYRDRNGNKLGSTAVSGTKQNMRQNVFRY